MGEQGHESSTATSRVAVLLVTGRHVGSAGLKSILLDHPGVRFRDAPRSPEAIVTAARTKPAVILVAADDVLAEIITFTAGLRENTPDSKIIVFCDRVDRDVLRALLRLDVNGCLLWPDLTPETLQAALTLVLAGVSAVTARAERELVGGPGGARESAVKLTENERGAIRGLDAGLDQRQIADAEHMSRRSAKRAVRSLKEKLGAESLYQLGKMVERLGLGE